MTNQPHSSAFILLLLSASLFVFGCNSTLNPLTPITNSIGINFVYIPPGEFLMGSPASETGRNIGELQHKVIISKGLYMATTEVTQAQWKIIMQKDDNPSVFTGDDLPVENVYWHEAVEYCRRLSKKEGKAYRLPTESEWEYACRAGTKTKFNLGDNEEALNTAGWYAINSGGKTHPVGKKSPNAWGLYDVHGNVWEWCSDIYVLYPGVDAKDLLIPPTGKEYCLRGGCWFYGSNFSRSAFRNGGEPDLRNGSTGFRVVLDCE